MTQYNKIANEYKNVIKDDIVRIYGYEPLYFNTIGNLKGKAVLDLACGEGLFTRKMVERGASQVEGVDISEKMIELARNNKAFSIKYHLYDVAQMPKLGEFDVVTAPWLLHYAKSKEELLKMCSVIVDNLKKGGKFVGLIPNPNFPIVPEEKYRKYRVSSILESAELKEGCKIKITLYNAKEDKVSFSYFHWSADTYLSTLKKSGLRNTKMIPASITEEGIQKYGKDFWEYYQKNPETAIIYGEKE